MKRFVVNVPKGEEGNLDFVQEKIVALVNELGERDVPAAKSLGLSMGVVQALYIGFIRQLIDDGDAKAAEEIRKSVALMFVVSGRALMDDKLVLGEEANVQ